MTFFCINGWGDIGNGYLEIKKFSGVIKLTGLGAGLQVYNRKHDDLTSAFSSAVHDASTGTLGVMTCVKCLGQRLTRRLRSPVMTGYYEKALPHHKCLRIASLRIVTKQRLEGKLAKSFKVSIGFLSVSRTLAFFLLFAISGRKECGRNSNAFQRSQHSDAHLSIWSLGKNFHHQPHWSGYNFIVPFN